MQEPITLYKLIVLYMLERSGFPLTRTQVTDFLLNREYTTNFLNLQQAIGELIDDGLLSCVTARNRSYLGITDEGSETLNFFKNQIDRDIRTDIDNYLKSTVLSSAMRTPLWQAIARRPPASTRPTSWQWTRDSP